MSQPASSEREMIAVETTRLVPENGMHSSARCIESQTEVLNGHEEEVDGENGMTFLNDTTKSIVFGGYDGLLASLAIISGSAGGGLSWRIVLVVGFSNILANSLSTGISEFLSSKAHKEFLQAEKRRELWEFKHYRDGEILEMVNRFEARGMARRDAEVVVAKMAQYESFFVGLMVSEELGLQVPENDDSVMFTDAFVMFLSFACFGSIPLSIFCAAPLELLPGEWLFAVSSGVSLTLLCILGMVKSSFSSAPICYAAMEAVGLGLICSSVSYAVGTGVMRIVTK